MSPTFTTIVRISAHNPSQLDFFHFLLQTLFEKFFTQPREATLKQGYPVITSEEDRKPPKGKYRVMLNDRGEKPTLYFIGDHDTAEAAIRAAEKLGTRNQNGIVQDSKGWVLYPWFDGHQIRT